MRSIRFLLALAPLVVLPLPSASAGVQQEKPVTKETPAEKPVTKETPAEKPVAKEAKAEKPAAAAEIGKPAPDFVLKDLDGKPVKLSDYKGKTVVLEWFNPECPVVASQHSKGVLKDYASKAVADGVVWLAINSGASGMQGHGVEKNQKMRGEWKLNHPILLDEAGTVGRAYAAKTTPHMFVIDAKGTLVYRGAIDNNSSGEPEGGKLVNYVEAALADLKAGREVATKETKSYGCNVKYGKPGA